ncbi:DUF4278 domain-containing protein [Leptolyngbya sp. AN02str]|uniref:DUF4278 domain-containing protein n=1 Tax=Leptolyngbya sp. AN02str TaxID=3423363 RepID=UPI003D320672
MNLNYRGVTYNYTSPTVGVQNSHPTTTNLKYRGNMYATNVDVAPEAVEVAPVAVVAASDPVVLTTSDRARALMMNHHRQVKRRQQVMLTRLATSVGLDGSKSAQYWNHVQGKVHPGFWNTYDRSHASIS